MTTPTGIDCISAKLAASVIAENMNTVYWLESRAVNNDESTASKMMRQEAWVKLEQLAALFGAELVEIEPEQDEDPVDAEIVEEREAYAKQQIVDAGRGHLIGGAS